jgi:hypothetical protein
MVRIHLKPEIEMNGTKLILLVCFIVGSNAGCSATSAQRAGEGALTGAAAGAVGSMFAAAIFGGDVGDAAARGAAWGAGAGAVTGAITGSQEDARHKEQEAAEARRQEQAYLNALREEIGPDTFAGLEALTDGKHQVALAYARTAMESSEVRYVRAGHWLEAMTHQDLDDVRAVADCLPMLVEVDPEIANQLQARETLDELARGLADIRERYI